MIEISFVSLSHLQFCLSVSQSAKSLQNNKDSRILWVKEDLLLTTGFDMVRKCQTQLMELSVFLTCPR